ncbi:MAG: hypothetical protein RIB67_01795 [Miltoncostaeaceae bacterium]
MTTRPVGVPAPARVIATPVGTPHAVVIDGRRRRVLAVRDDWRIQDRWWTDAPVDRHYFEVVVEPGRLMVIYRERPSDDWFAHP